MSFLGSLFSVGGASPISALGEMLDKLFTSDEERAQADLVLQKLKQHPAELQVAINKIEAQHRSVFVAGWRPFIGWVCGFSLGFYYIPQYGLAAYLWAHQLLSMETVPDALPPFPSTADGLTELVLALLGMGIIRSVEKVAGKSK